MRTFFSKKGIKLLASSDYTITSLTEEGDEIEVEIEDIRENILKKKDFHSIWKSIESTKFICRHHFEHKMHIYEFSLYSLHNEESDLIVDVLMKWFFNRVEKKMAVGFFSDRGDLTIDFDWNDFMAGKQNSVKELPEILIIKKDWLSKVIAPLTESEVLYRNDFVTIKTETNYGCDL
jgi:hypothetical protein